MTIISPLPYTLQNGNSADASQVMANLNQIRDDVNNSNNRGYDGATVWKSLTQAIPAATVTKIILDTELSDSLGLWTSGAPTRFTITSGISLVRVRVQTHLTVASPSTVALDIAKNNSSIVPYINDARILASSSTFSVVSFPISVSTGDYLEAAIISSVAGTLNYAPGLTWMEVEVLR